MRFRTARSSFSLVVLAAFGLLLWPATAEAQRGRGQAALNELTVFGGVSLLSPETTDPDRPVLDRGPGGFGGFVPGPFHVSTTLDGSAEFGVRFSRYVAPGLSVGGDFSIAPSHDLTEITGYGCPIGRFCIAGPEPAIFAPDIRRTARVVAYHYGGQLGFDLTRGTIRPSVIAGLGAVTYDAASVRDTDLALRVGAGLAATAGRLVTRLEVLDVITADHFVTDRSEHDVHVRVGLGVRW